LRIDLHLSPFHSFSVYPIHIGKMLASRFARAVRIPFLGSRLTSRLTVSFNMQLPRASPIAARSAAFVRQPLVSQFARYESTAPEGKVQGAVIGIDLGRSDLAD
jgi:hypothetical protein